MRQKPKKLLRSPTQQIVYNNDTGISDTGATGIFLKDFFPHTNLHQTNSSIIVGSARG